MKRMVRILLVMVLAATLTGCATTMKMQNINNPAASLEKVGESGKIEMLIQPHQTLGLEPTAAVCRGDISAYQIVFPKRLLGEYFPGTLRWNVWVIRNDGSESFGQVLFSGIHPSGDFLGTVILDGKISSGQLVILSTDMQFIYSPLEREMPVEREKFLTDPAYRQKMIKEINRTVDEKDFNISSLTSVENFQAIIKGWNQIQFPEGYLLSPYGMEEIALIRGKNPQYSYFEKLIGTGRFAIRVGIDPIGMAIVNAAGIAMDLIRATGAPSKGRDFSSEVNRREASFTVEYLLTLAQSEIKKRNEVNVALIKKSKNERSSP
jgi:hypothetical protein